jgi:hypothetical protein
MTVSASGRFARSTQGMAALACNGSRTDAIVHALYKRVIRFMGVSLAFGFHDAGTRETTETNS